MIFFLTTEDLCCVGVNISVHLEPCGYAGQRLGGGLAPCLEHAALLVNGLVGIDYWLLAPLPMSIIGCCMLGGVDISRNGLERREACTLRSPTHLPHPIHTFPATVLG